VQCDGGRAAPGSKERKMRTSKSKRTAKARRRVLILDDHPITRYGLTQLINHEPDLLVCGEAASAPEALAAIKPAQPDVVLADISMPGRSGLEFIKDMQAQYPEVPVLVMSMHDESIYAERVLRAGGRGYIMKNEGGERLLEAMRRVLGGQICVSQNVSAAVLEVLTRRGTSAGEATPRVLSDREFEVFQLIGQELSTQQIGRRLNLSVKTVGTHRQHIKEKLKARTAPELIKQAVRWAAAEQLV
jgi:DNA-binding NarL/FixJ family response regulator